MASEQVIACEVIAKAVVEATRVPVQAVTAAVAEKPQSMAGPKIGGPAMKQPTFSWGSRGQVWQTQNIEVGSK